MTRIYLKQKQKETKLMKLAKELKADYVEMCEKDSYMVFKIPKKIGKYGIAVALYEDKTLAIGKINEECDNFESVNKGSSLYKQELEWIDSMFKKLEDYVKKGKETK